MAMAIRSIPVLTGEAARRFNAEAKANLKKRGSQPISQERRDAFKKILEETEWLK
jgi:hypothetical protein